MKAVFKEIELKVLKAAKFDILDVQISKSEVERVKLFFQNIRYTRLLERLLVLCLGIFYILTIYSPYFTIMY